MSDILVIGHRNPDTDAICSAIGYAEFKRRTGMRNVEAARCGDTNDRIDFVLKSFLVPPPRFVADVSPKVRDVMQANVVAFRLQEVTAARPQTHEHLAILRLLGIERGVVAVTKADLQKDEIKKLLHPDLKKYLD